MHVCGVMACLGFPPIYHVTLSIAISKYARNSRHNVIFHGHVARCRSQNLGNKSNIFMKITSDSPPVRHWTECNLKRGFKPCGQFPKSVSDQWGSRKQVLILIVSQFTTIPRSVGPKPHRTGGCFTSFV